MLTIWAVPKVALRGSKVVALTFTALHNCSLTSHCSVDEEVVDYCLISLLLCARLHSSKALIETQYIDLCRNVCFCVGMHVHVCLGVYIDTKLYTF